MVQSNVENGVKAVAVKGGTFSGDVSAYLAEGMKQDPSGKVVVGTGGPSYGDVAVVGNTGYKTLTEAINAANENDIVTLYGAVNENVTISKSLTLQGGTINGTVTVEAGVKLTIDGVTIAATEGPGIAVTGMGVELEVKGENSVTSTAQNYAGVEVPMETSLTITGEGNLTAKGNGGAGVGGSCNGGVAKWLNGDITVDMTGTLEAVGTGSQTNGNYGGAGIGAASYHNPADINEQMPGTITIENGTIIATGGNSCAGIGGGSHTPTGVISIEGGNITAVSAGGAGIGSGSTGKGTAAVTISGGTINATGGWLAAGIGGSYKAGANVTITGGNITAQGGNGNAGTTYQGGPGIGGGYHGNGEVSISDATVRATGGNSAPGIGTGAVSGSSKVTITSGDITAQGGCNAPGIGGGNAISNVEVSITGGTVDAKGGTRVDGAEVMPGIGSGITQEVNDNDHTSVTTGNITIGPGATLTDGTTIGAPAGNKFYMCTVRSDGSRVYGTTEYDANTVALLISGENIAAYSDLAQAIAAASERDTVRLVANVTLNAALNVNKAITLDLNGKTLTLAIMDDGLVGYSGCTIQNGNIVYTGTKNAIKAENIALIDGVDVKAENADVGVMIWGNGRHLDVISNSTITGAKRGISTYKVNPDGNTVSAIGEMNKVTVDAKEYGVVINLSHCGKIVDSDITGGNRGISFQWHNDNAAYPPAKCEITGGTVTAKNGPAIEFWDNRGVTGEGYTVATEINGTRLSGTEANTGALIYSLAKGNVKFEATVDGTNAVCGCENAPWSNEWSESRWFDSFASAIANVNWSSKPLELLANVNETVTINKRVAVNLNGHTLNGLALGEGGTVVADGSVGIIAPEGFVVVESVSDGTYTYTLRAVVPVTGVTLSQTNASMYTGNTVNLTATVTPDDADDKTVTWSSSNTSVATVDANGVVTAVGTGTANITATVGTVSATCEVTVSTYTGGGTVYYPSTPTPTPPVVDITDPDVPLAELPLPFEDVKDGDWYREAVAYVYSNGLMVGTSDTLFGVNTNTSRGMMATVIYRLDKEPNTTFEKIFSDVDNGMWYSNPITWANANKVTVGYDDGSFGPNDNVTREQLIAMLYRYAGNKGYDVSKRADLSVFADAGKVSGYAEEAMSWAVAVGLIQGRGASKLAPTDLALRVEVAAIFQRFASLYEAETLA